MNPNGLAVAADGTLYVSDYRVGGGVWTVPTDGGAPTLVAAIDRPNGLAVTADGAGLLVAAETALLRIDLATGAVAPLATTDGLWTTVSADACGGVWTVGYNDGVVVHLPPDGPPQEVLRLEDPGLASLGSSRFGTGSAAWPADVWLVGAYHTGLFVLDLGVPGVR